MTFGAETVTGQLFLLCPALPMSWLSSKTNRAGQKKKICPTGQGRAALACDGLCFGVSHSEKFFHSLKSALVIEAHAAKDGSILEQYQKGNPEKSIIH
jgi:hypothetical protein